MNILIIEWIYWLLIAGWINWLLNGYIDYWMNILVDQLLDE